MKNFKIKDLMVAIHPVETGSLDIYNCEHKSKSPGNETGCTKCTHVTVTDCTKHSKKPPKKSQLKDSIKATELSRLRKSIAKLQEKEYA